MIRLVLLLLVLLSACGATNPDETRAAFAGVPPLVIGDDVESVQDPAAPRPSVRPVRGVPVAAVRDASPPAGGPFRYSYEQLESGDVDRILTGTGPLWTPTEQLDYHAEFSDVPPYMIRFGISLQPLKRRANNELVRDMRHFLMTFAGQIPLITIKFDVTDRENESYGLSKEVLAGEMDDTLVMLSRIIREAGRPVFVRIGPEVNGYWNNYDPDLYPKAFRYIADLLRREGCDQIITVWNVKFVPGQDRNAYLDWYPGDDAVDWWSVDLFREDFAFAEGRDWVTHFLDTARVHGKPVIIPESCPNGMNLDSDRTWNAWFKPYFDLIERTPSIKGFCYSNRDFGANDVKLAEWGDMRIDKHALKAKWRAELSKPVYLKEQPGAAETVRAHYDALEAARGTPDARADEGRPRDDDARRRRAAAARDAGAGDADEGPGEDGDVSASDGDGAH
ncbi:MAG: hypothetical protein H6825_01785 [Planctomycetes bacterium]|nr:hypothetical protein [Planctomycetota bacterium]